ncbi:hypothetical protein R3P38DRAFT_3231451 [Favolaschia claudopus]|uniref:Uncharacterized protein n=1 Tax=Favolaschia claudopus TaxID=2862362 RepID=A0AAV9ZKL3_9AGAR
MGKNKKNNNKGGKKTEVQTVEGNSVDAQIASIQSVDNTSTIAQPNKSPPPVEPPQELIPDTISAVPPSRASTASPRNPPLPMRASPKIRVSLARTGTPISSSKAPTLPLRSSTGPMHPTQSPPLHSPSSADFSRGTTTLVA